MLSKKLLAKCCCWLFCVLLSQSAFSQELSVADSRLYNGVEYIRNGTPAKGFPFWDADSLRPGTLCYNNLVFPGVPMEYDLVEDKLIIPYYTGHPLISLISERISYFSIGSGRFRYIDADSNTSGLPAAGFYQELCGSGSNVLLARREKKLVYPNKNDELPGYTQHTAYFLLLDGHYTPIEGENDLLEIAKDKKDAVKQYIRKNKLRFNKNREDALTRAAAYYLQIRH
jgi:hypothetical protein